MAGYKKAVLSNVRDNYGSDRGAINRNGRSDDETLTLYGNGTAGGTIRIYDGKQFIGKTTIGDNGRWTFTTDNLDHGAHTFGVRSMLPSGRVSKLSRVYKVFVDTRVNELDNFELQNSGDNHVINGRGEGFATISIFDNGVKIGQTKANKFGAFSFDINGDTTNGEHAITIVQQDIAGNVSGHSQAKTFFVQNGAGGVFSTPIVNSAVVDGDSFLISGTAVLPANLPFSVTINGETYSLNDGIVVDGNTWSLVVDAKGWADGDYEVTATVGSGSSAVSDSSTAEVSYRTATNIGQAGIDSDGDEVPDDIDIDDDNDGILDINEGTGDIDRDGIINSLDLDSDGDGIADNIEAQSTSGFIDAGSINDVDFDGLNDAYDKDLTSSDAVASAGITAQNTDNTGFADYKDFDSDDDGLLDIDESGIAFRDISTDYSDITGGIYPSDLSNSFGSNERDYREVNPNVNNPIGPIKDVDIDLNEITENAAQGSVVGLTANAIDPDSKDVVHYELSNDANGRFAINATTGVVTLRASLDYSQDQTHTIEVTAHSSDGSSSLKEFVINVLEDNSPIGPVTDVDNSDNRIYRTATVGTEVGLTGFAQDPDASDQVSYSLFDDANGRFAIDSDTGVVTLAREIPGSTASSYDITIKATSTDHTVSAETFTIEIENNQPIGPVIDIDSSANKVSECARPNTLVGIVARAIDPDTSGSVVYKLTDNAGGLFRINSQTGKVYTTQKGLDFETASHHDITISATSPDGSMSEETMRIDVIDQDVWVVLDDLPDSWDRSGARFDITGSTNARVGSIITIRQESFNEIPTWGVLEHRIRTFEVRVQSDGTFIEANVKANINPPQTLHYTDQGTFGPPPYEAWSKIIAYTGKVIPDPNDDCRGLSNEEFMDVYNGEVRIIRPPGSGSPIVLDLDGDGVETLAMAAGTRFDLDGDGYIDTTGWVAPDDGLLVFDRNDDGLINSGQELFGEFTLLENGEQAHNGFVALSELDSSKDGLLDSNDEAYALLQVWQDKNSDGISQADELVSLSEAGIKSIELDYDYENVEDYGNGLLLQSIWRDMEGNEHDAIDVYFQYEAGDKGSLSDDELNLSSDNQAFENALVMPEAMLEALANEDLAVRFENHLVI